MIAAVGDAKLVRPWLDSDHGGRSLARHEIDQTLTAATTAGLDGYLFYCPLEAEYLEVARLHAAARGSSL